MKKILTSALVLAVGLTLNAEELKTLSLGIGIPGIEEPMLIGLGISPDGRYVCGPIDFGAGVFAMDVQTGAYKYEVGDDCELRNIDMNGLAIGYMDEVGVTYDYDGTLTTLKVPESGGKYILGEDLTNDGSIKVGSLVVSGMTHAVYSINGGEWIKLPVPETDKLSHYFESSTAKAISGDGKYIIGEAANAGPIIMWTRNEDGSYEPDPLYDRYCAFDEAEEDEKPLAGLFPMAISNNGRYVLCRSAKYLKDEKGGLTGIMWFPSVYDTTAGELKLYDEFQEIDEAGMGLTGSSIADDGTFVGMIGNAAMLNCAGGFIMRAGETQAQLLTNVFPKYDEVYGVSDMFGYSVPTDISADGRYILGYAFYSEDFADEMAPAYYATYIIEDTEAAVDSIKATGNEEAIYSLDGLRRSALKPGLNIVRSADGTVRKVIKK